MNVVEEIEYASLDIRREFRAGIPEVILGEVKTPSQVVEIASVFLKSEGRAIVTKVSEEHLKAIREAFSEGCELDVNERARLVVVRRRGFEKPSLGRKIGVMTGGTADIAIAEEARVMAEEMGCQVITAYDVGIAGFHRHLQPLRKMLEEGVDAIVVVAGMEGALPSVVASLVDIPVIGVPSPTGYGFGGKGMGALIGMLQSCSPGLCVVNINNGIGAGAFAALIARRVAEALKAVGGGK
ncbi:MAG TPA: nickel pincer cofactor biosynthesis protein LarB [Chloroflexi bacterium]|nr:nickel pincer cofactor biosynthesis protein LarB [Chloroflexota bacterium]